MTETIYVLLLEDNEADVDLTREMLSSTKFNIKLSVAKDGVDAIDHLNGAGSWSEPGHPTLSSKIMTNFDVSQSSYFLLRTPKRISPAVIISAQTVTS
jgi:CheY-like chemotaxis protein